MWVYLIYLSLLLPLHFWLVHLLCIHFHRTDPGSFLHPFFFLILSIFYIRFLYWYIIQTKENLKDAAEKKWKLKMCFQHHILYIYIYIYVNKVKLRSVEQKKVAVESEVSEHWSSSPSQRKRSEEEQDHIPWSVKKNMEQKNVGLLMYSGV